MSTDSRKMASSCCPIFARSQAGTPIDLDFHAGSRLDFTGAAPDTANTAGGLIKAGTSSIPIVADVADMRFIDLNFDNGAASGDNRGMYLRLALTGGGGGEAARIFTNVDSNLGTAHGAHISMDFAATAGGSECSGLGVAARCTLHIPDIASWAPTGTYAAVQAEIYSDGAASDPAGMTALSFIRICSDGHATGMEDVDTDAVAFDFVGFTSGATSLWYDHTDGAYDEWIKVRTPSGIRYIPLMDGQAA